MNKRKLLPIISAAAIVCTLSFPPGAGTMLNAYGEGLPTSNGNKLRMWYKKPVASWTNDALVQGNGHTGLMAFGDPAKERLHFNENTLWTGGPSASRPNYEGSNRSAANAVTKEKLNAIREKADDHSKSVFPLGTGGLNDVMGSNNGMGMYQDFGDIYLDFAEAGIKSTGYTNYVRDLDMRTGISNVNFDYDSVHYEREYFVSYPDNVAVVKLTASQPRALSFKMSLSMASGLAKKAITADAESKKLTYQGTVSDNQLKAEMQVKIINTGGEITADGESLIVSNADEVYLVYTTGTDYKNEYPKYRGKDPHDEVTAAVDNAAVKSYETLRKNHVDDHSELFSRVEIDLGGECPDIPTNELMANYRKGDYKTVVEEMVYQFGRYLTIAGSRNKEEVQNLPTNLCGIWLIGSAGSFWGADFHFNVNVQMNYWPAMQTNLAECALPFTDYVKSLVIPGRITADRSAAVKTENFTTTPIGEGKGFLVNTQNNPFGNTAPFGSQEFGWNIGGSSWALQNVYDYYLFTGDEEYLESTVYPLLKEQAAFWNEFLWYSEYQERLVVGPSVSAEQGPTVNGTAYDQSIVWELYEMAIKASKHLGVDADLRTVWEDKQSQLDPIQVGIEGQVKEWFEETTLGKAKVGELPEINIPNFGAGGSANQGSVHRHTSQLIGLFPGTLINDQTPEWMAAAKKSLEQRSLNGTGWSKAMKINMYARTGLAEDTYSMIRAMCAGNTNGMLDNLLDSHPPFQIDGNFGYTAGLTEMLLQSQWGYTQFLPTLPEKWKTGSVKGLVSRGNFVIDMEWSEGDADLFTITSQKGGTFVGEYENIAGAKITNTEGEPVAVTKDAKDKISFETVKGEAYVIDMTANPAKLIETIETAKELSNRMVSGLLEAPKATLDAAIDHAEQMVEDGADTYGQEKTALTLAMEEAQKAINLLKEINTVKAFVESLKDDALAVIKSVINDSISNAEDVLKNEDDYTAEIGKLKQDVSKAETGIALLAKIKEAENYAASLLIGTNEWEYTQAEVDTLTDEISAARLILGKSSADKTEYTAASGKIQSIMNTLKAKPDSVFVTIAKSGSTVTMTSPFDSLEIRYTLDGTVPNGFSNLYKEAFLITGSASIKAGLFYKGTAVGLLRELIITTSNIAPTAKEAIASDFYDNMVTYNGQKAVDGNTSTRWATNDGVSAATLTLTFDTPVSLSSAAIYSYTYTTNYISEYSIEYKDGEAWKTAYNYEGEKIPSNHQSSFPAFTASEVRLNIKNASNPSIYEFSLFPAPQSIEVDKAALTSALNIAGYAVERGIFEDPATSVSQEPVQLKFNNAVAYAKYVLSNTLADQITVDDAEINLSTILEDAGLVQGNTNNLKNLYHICIALDESEYTSASWSILSDALVKANNRITQFATQSEINSAYNALTTAYINLKPAVLKQVLNQYIAEATEILKDVSKLRPGKVTALREALESAEEAAASQTVTQEEVNNAADLLLEAIVNLKNIVDRSDLEALIALLEALDASRYSSSTWADLQAALDAANEVDDDSEKADVNKAYEDLQNAFNNLKVLVNKTALKNAMDKAEYILENKDLFAPASIEGLKEIYNKAKKIFDDENSTQSQVNSAAAELAGANAKARVKEDKTALLAAVNKFSLLKSADYTTASFGVLSAKIEAANLVLNDDNATKAEVEKALGDLNIAGAQLKQLSTSGDNAKGNPKTGDMLPLMLMFMLGLPMAALVITRKRKIN